MSFVYVGRLDELKGLRTVFDAWKLMGKEAPHLIVCGKGPMENWCNQNAICLNIEMRGFVDSRTVKRIIAECDAVLLPSLWYEGFPMTIAEAFSCGTPVICSDLGNTGNIIEEGVTGWKFEAGSAQGLIQALQKCLHSDSNIRDRVKRTFNENYTPDVNYRRLEEIYREVSNANRSFGIEHR